MRYRIGTLAALAAVAGAVACEPLGIGGGGTVARAPVDGAALYAEYCLACHGASGRGDGPAAAGLTARPADLTALAARNRGVFPAVRVMGKVYGYSQGRGGGGGPMPEFGPLLEGETVLIETDPGIFTPTPERLVALAEHVRSLGR
jgi:mono/diheme cytochrome c family protein